MSRLNNQPRKVLLYSSDFKGQYWEEIQESPNGNLETRIYGFNGFHLSHTEKDKALVSALQHHDEFYKITDRFWNNRHVGNWYPWNPQSTIGR